MSDTPGFMPTDDIYAATAGDLGESVEESVAPVKTNAGHVLESYLARIERLEGEKKELGADIREIYAEAKGNGFDTKAMRRIIKIRQDIESAKEEEATVEMYLNALGITF